MAEFMGYEVPELDGQDFVLVDLAHQHESVNGDDLAILRDEAGHLWEFQNGDLRKLAHQGSYSLRKENDFVIENDHFNRVA